MLALAREHNFLILEGERPSILMRTPISLIASLLWLDDPYYYLYFGKAARPSGFDVFLVDGNDFFLALDQQTRHFQKRGVFLRRRNSSQLRGGLARLFGTPMHKLLSTRSVLLSTRSIGLSTQRFVFGVQRIIERIAATAVAFVGNCVFHIFSISDLRL